MTINKVLNEGIKYFKFSSRIDTYIKKLNKKKIKDGELAELISKLKTLQNNFKKLEMGVKKATSKEELKVIKSKWEVLKLKNEKFLKLIRKDEIKKTAIFVGVFALALTTAILLKKGITEYLEETNEKLGIKVDEISKAPHNTQYDENGKRIVPEQRFNPSLAKPIETYKGFVVPEPGTYSKSDLLDILKKECEKQKFPFEVAKEIAKAESSVSERAISPDGNSVGLMQLNVKFADDFKKKFFSGNPEEFNPFDPKVSAESAIKYMKYLIKKNNGDLKAALMDYNAGPNRSKTTEGTIRYASRILTALGRGGSITDTK